MKPKKVTRLTETQEANKRTLNARSARRYRRRKSMHFKNIQTQSQELRAKHTSLNYERTTLITKRDNLCAQLKSYGYEFSNFSAQSSSSSLATVVQRQGISMSIDESEAQGKSDEITAIKVTKTKMPALRSFLECCATYPEKNALLKNQNKTLQHEIDHMYTQLQRLHTGDNTVTSWKRVAESDLPTRVAAADTRIEEKNVSNSPIVLDDSESYGNTSSDDNTSSDENSSDENSNNEYKIPACSSSAETATVLHPEAGEQYVSQMVHSTSTPDTAAIMNFVLDHHMCNPFFPSQPTIDATKTSAAAPNFTDEATGTQTTEIEAVNFPLSDAQTPSQSSSLVEVSQTFIYYTRNSGNSSNFFRSSPTIPTRVLPEISRKSTCFPDFSDQEKIQNILTKYCAQ